MEKYLPTLLLLAVLLWIVRKIYLKLSQFRKRYLNKKHKGHYYDKGRYVPARENSNLTETRYHQKAAPKSAANHNDQIDLVVSADFFKRKIMNKEEYRVFRIAEKCAWNTRRGYRVFAQTCMGEILGSKESEAQKSINSKRIDVVITNSSGFPVIAIEYQGGGHYQGTNYAHRDAVKRTALQKAGIDFLEIFEKDTEEEIRVRITSKLQAHTTTYDSTKTELKADTQPTALDNVGPT